MLKCCNSFLYTPRILPNQKAEKRAVCLRARAQSSPALCGPMDCSPPLSMGFPGRTTGVGYHFLLQGGLPNPGTEPRSPVFSALQVDSLPAEPLGKLKSGLALSNSEVMKKLG